MCSDCHNKAHRASAGQENVDPLAQIGQNACDLMAALPIHSHHRQPLLQQKRCAASRSTGSSDFAQQQSYQKQRASLRDRNLLVLMDFTSVFLTVRPLAAGCGAHSSD